MALPWGSTLWLLFLCLNVQAAVDTSKVRKIPVSRPICKHAQSPLNFDVVAVSQLIVGQSLSCYITSCMPFDFEKPVDPLSFGTILPDIQM